MIDLIIFAGFAALISLIDIRSYRIPDVLCAFCFAGLLAYCWFEKRLTLPAALFTGLVSALVFWLIRWKTRGLGLGDVKFAALIGFFCGFPGVCAAFFIAALSALLITLALPFLFPATERGSVRLVRIPFAPFLSLGAIAAWLLNHQGLL
jgi:prepilin signal peptidase PulO-like enzyme (type II secretory pathway)